MKSSNISKKVIILLLLCMGMTRILQAQSDRMIVGQDTFFMNKSPLDVALYEKVCERIKVIRIERGDTCYWSLGRKFEGLWKLEQGELCLVTIQGNFSESPKAVDLSGIFDAYMKRGRIVASWFSGELRVERGDAVAWPPLPCFGHVRLEHEIVYAFEKGKVVSKKEFHNTLRKASIPPREIWNNVFNSEHLPWEEDMRLLVSILPQEDGMVDSVQIFKEISWKHELLSDDNSFAREAKACIALIPDWDVLVLEDTLRPVTLEIRKQTESPFIIPDYWKAERNHLDTLVDNGEMYGMLAYPLQVDQRFFTSLRQHLKGSFTPENPRGYTARWKLEDDQLFLTEIRDARTNEIIPLSVFDPGNKNEAIPASWYTGELKVLAGDPLYTYYGLKDTYEKEIVFYLTGGRVISRAVFDNYLYRGDTVAQNLCDKEIEMAFREQFPEWKGKVVTTFTIHVRLDGTVRNVEYDGISLYGNRGEEMIIKDMDHPCMKLIREAVERVPRWEVRIVRGELKQPLNWGVRVRL